MVLAVANGLRREAQPAFVDGVQVVQANAGAYRGAGTESFMLWRPGRTYQKNRLPVVVYCHGLLGFGTDSVKSYLGRQLAPLVQAGFAVIAADLGGPATWGTDDSRTALGQALSYATSQYGIPTDRVALFMESMGFVVGTYWMASNVGRVVWAYGIVPVMDMAAVAARPANAALAASMHSAYGSEANWTAALPTHNPSAAGVTAKISGLGSRMRLDGDQNDVINWPDDYQAFRTAVPGVDVRMRPGSHQEVSRATGDAREVAAWARRMSEIAA